MKKLQKALIICISGQTIDNLNKFGHFESIKTVMIGDRISDRVKESRMLIFDGMSKGNSDLRKLNWELHLQNAYDLGLNI
jgi:NAD(P)H dehydrogenase (quinone)